MLIITPHILILLQELHRYQNQIIKIQGIVILQLLLVASVGPGNGKRPKIPAFLCPGEAVLRHMKLILFLADGGQYIFRGEGFLIQPHVLYDLFHHPLGIRGIVNRKAPGVSHPLNLPPEDPAAGGVEGHGPDILRFRPQQESKTLLEFIGRFICKGDGNNRPRDCRFHCAQPVCPGGVLLRGRFSKLLQKGHILLGDILRDNIPVACSAETKNVGNSVDQHGCFSAACPRKKQQRAFRGHNGLLLHFIQFLKLGGNITPPGGKKSGLQKICHSCTCLIKDATILPHFSQKVKKNLLHQIPEHCQRLFFNPGYLYLAD